MERFIEADVGMTFPLIDISDRLYASNGPWPAEYPFPPQAFKREDESDDYSFYAMPRFCYHIDEGAVRGITNYYKEAIAGGSRVLDICSSWVSHYPADFPAKVQPNSPFVDPLVATTLAAMPCCDRTRARVYLPHLPRLI